MAYMQHCKTTMIEVRSYVDDIYYQIWEIKIDNYLVLAVLYLVILVELIYYNVKVEGLSVAN